MPKANEKTTSESGRLWGWPDKEAEMAYVKRWADEFKEGHIGSATAASQVIQYPDEGVQCIQVEVWVKLQVEADTRFMSS